MKSKVYWIINDVDESIYVGSTSQELRTRFKEHRSAHKNPNARGYNQKICEHMRNIGISHFEIQLIEVVDVDDRKDLCWHEGIWINTFRELGYELLNVAQPNGISKSESDKKYYRKNEDAIKEKVKVWYQENKERSRLYHRQYYENNRERRIKRISEITECPNCGRRMTKGYLYRHKKKYCHQL